jgi:hypothetical protein
MVFVAISQYSYPSVYSSIIPKGRFDMIIRKTRSMPLTGQTPDVDAAIERRNE